MDRRRPAQQTFDGDTVRLNFDEALSEGLEVFKQASWCDAVHDSSSGLGSGSIAAIEPRRCCNRNAQRQPWPIGDRGADRVLCNTLALRIDLSVRQRCKPCWRE